MRHRCVITTLLLTSTNSAIVTTFLPGQFNAAVAGLAAPFTLNNVAYDGVAARNEQFPPRRASCLKELGITLALVSTTTWASRDVARFGPGDAGRTCRDARNFRVNGPEDARLLALNATHVLALYADFARGSRRMFRRSLDVRGFRLSEPLELSFAREAAGRLGAVEKNWSPFRRGADVYVWQWLDDANGASAVHRLRVDAARLEPVAAVAGAGAALREAVLGAGDARRAKLSGGAPPARLNGSHYLGVGHVQRHRRWYTLFAYWFAAEPPFGFAAATREFRFAVAAGGETAVDYDVATKPGVEDMIQFPVGLVVDGERALVTWGTNRNTESRATRVALAELERGAKTVGR